MTISDVILNLNAYEEESYILVPTSGKLTGETPVVIVPIPEEDPDADLGVSGFDYFIGVFLAKDILETWQQWRQGRIPTGDEAIEAIQYYKEHDTYLPTDEMLRGISPDN